MALGHTRSPLITHIAWGEMEIEGLGSARDVKLWPGGARAWDWHETGTHHVPGIQVGDVEELVANGAQVVVLSRGMELMLHTCPETMTYLDTRNVAHHFAETNEAVRIYNELARHGSRVGGLFHSTC